jgi:hypothetical protein
VLAASSGKRPSSELFKEGGLNRDDTRRGPLPLNERASKRELVLGVSEADDAAAVIDVEMLCDPKRNFSEVSEPDRLGEDVVKEGWIESELLLRKLSMSEFVETLRVASVEEFSLVSSRREEREKTSGRDGFCCIANGKDSGWNP